jgi:Glycosyl transferase family 2
LSPLLEDANEMVRARRAASGFSVVAIIAAYNEADIIDHVVSDLIVQGVDVYYLDDGSTDGTPEIVQRHLGRGVLAIEDLRETFKKDPSHGFEWERILRRKAELAQELNATWFIHHDADEFRESPWAGVPLGAAIERVDALGYSAIDFLCLDFRPVHDRFRPGEDVRRAFTFYTPCATYDRLQIRCWKKTEHFVDLASSGGHDAQFPGRRVFPIRFVLRHYPIRGQAHADRKVFGERRSRFQDRERQRGWHIQYDGFREGTRFILDPSTLIPYDPDEVRIGLTIRHRLVEELEGDLEETKSAVETLRSELHSRIEELDRRAATVAALEARVAARTADAADLRRELDERSIEASALREEVQQRTGDLDDVRCRFNAREAEIDDLRRRLEAGAVELAGLRNGLEESVRRVGEFRQSLSWRWTAPARAVYRLLTGRP